MEVFYQTSRQQDVGVKTSKACCEWWAWRSCTKVHCLSEALPKMKFNNELSGPGTGTHTKFSWFFTPKYIYITNTPTLVRTKWRHPEKIPLPSRNTQLCILNHYLQPPTGLGLLPFFQFWCRNAHTHFFNFTPGLWSTFCFGPTAPFLNFGPGGFAPWNR